MSDEVRDDKDVFHGSGNVYADLDMPDADDLLSKARLASLMMNAMEARGWTQKQTAKHLGIAQPDVSNITRGLFDKFSIERLMHFLAQLDYRVAITISGKDTPAQEFVIAPLPAVSSKRRKQPAEVEARP